MNEFFNDDDDDGGGGGGDDDDDDDNDDDDEQQLNYQLSSVRISFPHGRLAWPSSSRFVHPPIRILSGYNSTEDTPCFPIPHSWCTNSVPGHHPDSCNTVCRQNQWLQ